MWCSASAQLSCWLRQWHMFHFFLRKCKNIRGLRALGLTLNVGLSFEIMSWSPHIMMGYLKNNGKLFKSSLSKIVNCPSSELFFESKFHWIFTKMISLSENQSRRTVFIRNVCNLSIFKEVYLVKLCHNFVASD